MAAHRPAAEVVVAEAAAAELATAVATTAEMTSAEGIRVEMAAAETLEPMPGLGGAAGSSHEQPSGQACSTKPEPEHPPGFGPLRPLSSLSAAASTTVSSVAPAAGSWTDALSTSGGEGSRQAAVQPAHHPSKTSRSWVHAATSSHVAAQPFNTHPKQAWQGRQQSGRDQQRGRGQATASAAAIAATAAAATAMTGLQDHVKPLVGGCVLALEQGDDTHLAISRLVQEAGFRAYVDVRGNQLTYIMACRLLAAMISSMHTSHCLATGSHLFGVFEFRSTSQLDVCFLEAMSS